MAPGQLLGVRCALGCLRVELIEEVWANARGVHRSPPAASSLRDQLGTFAEFAKSLRQVLAQPLHFPESAEGGAPFTIKALPGAAAAA